MKRIVKAFSLISILIPLAACSNNNTRTLTFDANGGYFGENQTNTTLSLSGTINSIIDSSLYGTPLHTDEDYIFEGWVEKDSSSLLPSTLRYPYVDSTIYASWAKKVTITYVTGNEEYTHDPEVGLSGRTFTLWEPEIKEDDKFVFSGWYLDDQRSNAFNMSHFPEEDLTLYALFTAYPIITLHYSDDDTVTYQDRAGAKITENFNEVTVPTNHEFVGWFYTVSEGEGETSERQFFFDFMPNHSLDLYPKFESVVPVTISYDLGSTHTGSIPAINGYAGETISYDDRPDLSSIDFGNYTLDGWYYTDGDGDEVKFTFETYPSTSITLVARWVAYPQIIFDCSGYEGLSYPTLSLMPDSTIPALPVINNYGTEEFLYWAYYNEGGNLEVFNETRMPSTSVTLVPHFQNQRKISIEYTHLGQRFTTNLKREFYLPTSRDSVTLTWWNANVLTPEGYEQNGIYSGIYGSQATNLTKYVLPQSPTGDITYYVNLAKVVSVDVYAPTNPLWYVNNETPDFELITTLTGGSSMSFDNSILNSLIAKPGYTLEGFYESYTASSSVYDYINPTTFTQYPEDDNNVITEFDIYVKYFHN